MKNLFISIAILLIVSCSNISESGNEQKLPVTGSWQLIKAQTIEGKDTTTSYFTENKKAIKIITDTHFAFFQHDLNKGIDSTKIYVSGGGKCTIEGIKYTEYLEYCNYREWEGHTFSFELEVNGDTLIQKGIEKVEELEVDRVIIETYVRLCIV